MFVPIKVIITSAGEHVIFRMGSTGWTLHYETALQLSSWMRSAAKHAKRFAGDLNRITRAIGTLHDAEKGPDLGQPFTPGGLYPVNRDVVPLQMIGVKSQGVLVVIKLKNDTAEIPYKAAFAIAQWLRLRSKEAKRRAQDTKRHWSEIAA